MRNTVLLTIPGLRSKDLPKLPAIQEFMKQGAQCDLTPSFPCVTCCVQANITTGVLPEKHGILGNGLWNPETRQITMWTSTNEAVQASQLWDLIYHHPDSPRCAVWFPLSAVECGADYICTHKPIHKKDGSEELWCYTRPLEMYRELLKKFGHFPLMNYWGPMTSVKSARWIVDTACDLAEKEQPEFFYIYLAHLDYQAQRHGPDSPQALAALDEMNTLLGDLFTRFTAAYDRKITWMIAGEYVITPVNHVTYPNRILREAGLLRTSPDPEGGELLDTVNSPAFALCDHQFSHIYIRNHDPEILRRVTEIFQHEAGISDILFGEDLTRYGIHHQRTGDVVLISSPESWQAYYYWKDEAQAPSFARRVDIHRKPGYDPVELFFDHQTKSIPLNAELVKGSHGMPVRDNSQKTLFLSSDPALVPSAGMRDTDVFRAVMDSIWKR